MHNKEKSDVFAVALTILEAANLKSCFLIYNKRKIKLNDIILKALIVEAS